MLKRFLSFVLGVTLLMTSFMGTAYGAGSRINPAREELEKKIEDIAKRRGIPSVILKSIARVESVFQQYKPNGEVYMGSRGSIGLMQINNRGAGFDTNRLMHDIDYNINAGATMLLRKWTMANRSLPKIGNMDPNILEHWYFAVWAYNGWASSNNPNTGKKRYAYQDLVYMMADKEYGQKITPISRSLLPKSGKPSKSKHFNTPKDFHTGDIEIYKQHQLVKADVSNTLPLKKQPNGISIGQFGPGTLLKVLEGPKLVRGYNWYRVQEKDGSKTGWVNGSWIANVAGEVQVEQVDVTNTIEKSWAKDYIKVLQEKRIMPEEAEKIKPKDPVTREQLAVILGKTFELEMKDDELDYLDSNAIDPLAKDYVKAVSTAKIMLGSFVNTFNPKEYVPRQEIAVILTRALGEEEEFIMPAFSDADQIARWAESGVYNIYTKGLMHGNGKGEFKPKENVTVAEVAKLMAEIINKNENAEEVAEVEGKVETEQVEVEKESL